MEKNTIIYERLLQQIDEILSKEFSKIAPTNMESEKKKFLSSNTYNPKFSYQSIKSKTSVIRRLSNLKKIKLEKSTINTELERKAKWLEEYANLIYSIGNSGFPAASEKLYRIPSRNLIREAKKLLKTQHKEQAGMSNSSQAMQVAKDCIKIFDLKGWKSEYKELASNAMVQASTKTIFVKKESTFPAAFLKRMVVHEIATHVFRSQNGEAQPYSIFANGFPDYLETEEGLAANIEEMHGCLDAKTMKTYAGRVVAVDIASRKSFRKTYEYLLQWFAENEAWQITLRVKRGMSETSMKGCFSKDHLYLKGYFKVKKFLAKNPEDGIEKLFYGKIGIADIGKLAKIKGLVKPTILPNDKKVYEMIKTIW